MNFEELAKELKLSSYNRNFCLLDTNHKIFCAIRTTYTDICMLSTNWSIDYKGLHITDPECFSSLNEALKSSIISFTGEEKFNKYNSRSLFKFEIERELPSKGPLYCKLNILPDTDDSDGQKHIKDNDLFKSLPESGEKNILAKACPCGSRLVSEIKRTDKASWLCLCGREYKFTYCPKCGLIEDCHITMMN